jgi:hypothetical protein
MTLNIEFRDNFIRQLLCLSSVKIWSFGFRDYLKGHLHPLQQTCFHSALATFLLSTFLGLSSSVVAAIFPLPAYFGSTTHPTPQPLHACFLSFLFSFLFLSSSFSFFFLFLFLLSLLSFSSSLSSSLPLSLPPLLFPSFLPFFLPSFLFFAWGPASDHNPSIYASQVAQITGHGSSHSVLWMAFRCFKIVFLITGTNKY